MGPFVVATFNCFGQGQGLAAVTATRAPHAERFQHQDVKSTLAGVHILCVQEVLSRDAEVFFDALGAVRVRDSNHRRLASATFRGSGLGIASQVAFDAHHIESFGGPSAGWDRLARKGTLHARLTVDGAQIDILTGHLQSGYDVASARVRAFQIAELARRIDRLGSEERPFLLTGDFNVCGLEGGSAEYEQLRRALDGFVDLGAEEDLPTYDPHPDRNSLAHRYEPESRAQRIDYLFVRQAERGPRLRARDVTRMFVRPIGENTFASDHFGLSATFDVER